VRSFQIGALGGQMVCKDIAVSGWGNQAGIAYQQAHAVLTCLGMLDGESPDVTSISVESKEDAFDLELRNASGSLIKSRQIKTRQLDRTWAPSDVYPLLRRWATLMRPPSATFELVLGGRVGPTGERLIGAVHAAGEGEGISYSLPTSPTVNCPCPRLRLRLGSVSQWIRHRPTVC
jgi:hypothetical protein